MNGLYWIIFLGIITARYSSRIRTNNGGVRMKVIYYSLTGNVRRFIKKANYSNAQDLFEVQNTIIDTPFIIMTSTIGFGQVPDDVMHFLELNHANLRGVIASGNRNWGQNFAKSGDIIASQFHVPLLMKYELHGNADDVTKFLSIMEKVAIQNENFDREKVQSY